MSNLGSVLLATLSTYFSLVSSFCTLGQMFAADFFQIPPRDGHPCLSGYTIPTIRARWGLAPVRQCSCRAYHKGGWLENHPPLRISHKNKSQTGGQAQVTHQPFSLFSIVYHQFYPPYLACCASGCRCICNCCFFCIHTTHSDCCILNIYTAIGCRNVSACIANNSACHITRQDNRLYCLC